MPEQRPDEHFAQSEHPHKIKIGETPHEVSDEELNEEAKRSAMEKAAEMIDAISNLADAKVFLKKLCLRLFKNSALP